MSYLYLSFFPPDKNYEAAVAASTGIDPDAYVDALKAKWNDMILLRRYTGSNMLYSLEWEFRYSADEGAILPGALFGDRHLVHIWAGPNPIVIEFVLWHRAFVPAEREQFLFSEGDVGNILKIVTNTTYTEVELWLKQG